MRKWVKKHKKRIIAFILSFVIGVGSAFVLSCPAFADSNLTGTYCPVTYYYNGFSYSIEQPNVETVNWNALNSSMNSWINAEDRCFVDVHVTVKDQFAFSSGYGYNPNYTYYGYLQAFGNFTITATKVASNCVIDGIVEIDRKYSVPCQFSNSYNTQSYSVYNNFSALNINRNEAFYIVDNNFNDPGYTYNNSDYIFRVFYHSSDQYGCSVTIGVNLGTTPTGGGSITRFVSDTNILYNTLLTDQSILSAINNGNSSIVSAINSASSQAHTDSQTINNQLQGDDQILSDISDGQSLADQRIGAVDTIIASVAPDADQAIQNVSTVISDNGTFWSNQRNASLFWKEIISDMYDSTIMGYLGVGLSIVLIIILFVFILRL